eukprot:UN05425
MFTPTTTIETTTVMMGNQDNIDGNGVHNHLNTQNGGNNNAMKLLPHHKNFRFDKILHNNRPNGVIYEVDDEVEDDDGLQSQGFTEADANERCLE